MSTRSGQIFAQTTVAQPRVAARLMGTLVRGMGAEHVIGEPKPLDGAPQWQIEGLRRLEIPEEMRTQHGFAQLGAADGPVKRAILGENVARLYGFRREAELGKPATGSPRSRPNTRPRAAAPRISATGTCSPHALIGGPRSRAVGSSSDRWGSR